MTEKPEIRCDGGEASDNAIFELMAEKKTEPPTVKERASRMFYDYVVVTGKIVLSDVRTVIGLTLILAIILMGTIGPLLVTKPAIGMYPRDIGPFQSTKFILGTDGLGQPIGAQIVYATPAMLKMALSGAVIATGIGVLIGTTAGYKGGKVDTVLMTFTDIVLTMPGLPLIIIIAAIYQPKNPFTVGFILAIDNWPGLARKLRSQVLTIREESYVEASRTMGFSSKDILRGDIVPQLMPYITINSANASRAVIFESVGLYYLGVLPFTTINWGVMMNMAYENYAVTNWHLRGHWLWFPMLTLLVLSIGLILFSQGMDRVFNPRLRARHSSKSSAEDEGDEPRSIAP
ncbi:ABC transporter permease [Haladaptatus sp. CMAA 1911]|uniref:ABC transporter permease n=1 Tax=unclassified Haladaptatus TaxID=2622732 RepID=UPI0037551B52